MKLHPKTNNTTIETINKVMIMKDDQFTNILSLVKNNLAEITFSVRNAVADLRLNEGGSTK